MRRNLAFFSLLFGLLVACDSTSQQDDGPADSLAFGPKDTLVTKPPDTPPVDCPSQVRLFLQLGGRSDTVLLSHLSILQQKPGLLVVALANYPQPKDILPNSPSQVRLKLSLYDVDSTRLGIGPGTFAYLYPKGQRVILDLYWGKEQGYLFGSSGQPEVCAIDLAAAGDSLCGQITVEQAGSAIAPALRIQGPIRLPLGK